MIINFQWPVIGWKQKDEIAFFAEGRNHGTNASLEWAKNAGKLYFGFACLKMVMFFVPIYIVYKLFYLYVDIHLV